MKRPYLIQLLLTLLLITFPLLGSAQEVDFSIDRQDVQVQVHADGSATYKDVQYYNVGFMNGALFNLDHDNRPLLNYKVTVIDGEGEAHELTEDYTGEEHTYQITHRGSHTEFKVFYPAEQENVRFVYEYTLGNVITSYEDTAEFNQKVIGSNTNHSLDAHVTVTLPGHIDQKDDFRAWGYGAPQGDVTLFNEPDQSAKVQLDVPNNPPNQFVEAHIIFSNALVPNNTNRVNQMKKQEIIDKAQAQVEADARAREREQKTALGASLGTFLLALGLPLYSAYYYFTRKKRLNPHPVKLPDHIYDLPADITPAVMASMILHEDGFPDAVDFTATIVDLARKGYITLDVEEIKGSLFKKDQTRVLITANPASPPVKDLAIHEQHVLLFLQPEGQPVTLSALEQGMKKNSAFRKRGRKHWEGFRSNASVEAERLLTPPPQRRISQWLVAPSLMSVGIFVFVSLFALTALDGPKSTFVLSLMLIGAPLLALVAIGVYYLSKKRPIRTAKEDELYQEWNGFKNMLNDVGNFKMREVGSLALWEEYLVYAISLGVADKVIKQMRLEFPAQELNQMQTRMGTFSDPYFLTRSLQSSVNSAVAASRPPQTSSNYRGTNTGGFGGGFSGGSSGGFGGGSGSGGF
ncbi:DUF2207 domain-containing protein [Dolosicoccus paucivorans]|uniref:DUF2207 domain-containing protein n=1 Tax=Dolosicoccus paucivorans TaxID=84521 RepID=A0A1G8MWH9_9LACT|nr:DUF2207 domain-containing protein [Dolosicoccus paucivorans]PMB84829.1 DUF2207 domain-containing protein [Dolosicoccus paucivorans]PMC58529.1 DUF2207 domain-containing protein [Dolosicoccus paucivorans]SDI72175.1 Uncharacterized membrane protein [Dolosicoccus paucivorans]